MFIALTLGHNAWVAVHFPLELIGLASLIASINVFTRLFPQRAIRGLRLPFLLNALVLSVFVLALLIVVASAMFRRI
jgi:hypothetical protein